MQSKANANSVYTKTEADTLLSAKANASDVYEKSETYSDDEVDALLSDKADTADLATVALSGSYNDLSDKPTIPSGQIQSDWSQSDSTEVDFIKNKPTLATVATSGSYNDLSDKPTIPTVNDGTLTVKNGDQTKGTFTANQSSASNIVVLPFDIVGDLTTGFTPIYPS